MISIAKIGTTTNRAIASSTASFRVALLAIIFVLTFSPSHLYAADPAVQVQLNSTQTGPRAIEPLTERAILRDYRTAWIDMSQALESNTPDPIDGPFTGDAKQWLRETIADQRKSGLSQRYEDQNHKLEVVFYAPEGDVMELHDTVEFQHQVLDGSNLIQNQRVVVYYVVLMTPSADRWMVRYLQAVPQF
jgi:hypothetical protein